MNKSELDVICCTCRTKLRSIQEYFGFVLENQFKFNNVNTGANINNMNKENLSMIEKSQQPVSQLNPVPLSPEISVKEEPVDYDDSFEIIINHAAPLTPPTSVDEYDDDEEMLNDESRKKTCSPEIFLVDLKSIKYATINNQITARRASIKNQNELIAKFLNLKCQHCPNLSPFTDFAKLAYHSKKIHETALKISCCGKIFTKKFLYWRHLVKYHSEESAQKLIFPCPECNRSFPSLCRLKVHRYVVHFYCDLCSAKIYNKTSPPSLRSHLQQHALSKDPKMLAKFQCHHCPKDFGDRDKIKRHLQLVHFNKASLTICHKCGAEYKSRSAFILHYQRVHADKNGKYYKEFNF